jgi:hypothetical protein
MIEAAASNSDHHHVPLIISSKCHKAFLQHVNRRDHDIINYIRDREKAMMKDFAIMHAYRPGPVNLMTWSEA